MCLTCAEKNNECPLAINLVLVYLTEDVSAEGRSIWPKIALFQETDSHAKARWSYLAHIDSW